MWHVEIRILKNLYTYMKKMTLVKNLFYFVYFLLLFNQSCHRKCCDAVLQSYTGGSLHMNYLLNAAAFQVA
jgi:hypothetical protein